MAAAAFTALAFFAAAVVVGCGATRVEVRTQVAETCSTESQMEGCLLAMAQAILRRQNDIATVKESCAKRGERWSCLQFIDWGAGESNCYRLAVHRIGAGFPFVTGSAESYDCPWPA